jgi:acetolactate decarboxylase
MLSLALLIPALAAESDVQVIGEMRRMFTAHDIGANVELARINKHPHLYALGPVAGLRGEVTVLDGQVFVSAVNGNQPKVTIDPAVKTVFLVYSYVPAWRSVKIPANIVTENDLASFLEAQMPKDTRSAFRVRGTAETARYHIQNYKGAAKDLTHKAHDEAKSFYELENAPVELLGFFTNREEDGGTFVHMGQTTHVHLISEDRKHMGHLESIRLRFGAELLLPQLASRKE